MTSIIVHYILKDMEIEFAAPETGNDCRRLGILTGEYLVNTFGYSLQVNERFFVDADRLCQHIEVGKTSGRSPHLVVPLLEGFKREDGYIMHVLPIEKKHVL